MCKVYNQIGSLTTIKSHLLKYNLNDFNSLNELIAFQRNYSATLQQLISNHTILIEQEKVTLKGDIAHLENFIETSKSELRQKLYLELEQLKQRLANLTLKQSNIVKTFINYFKRNGTKRKIRDIELNFDSKIANSIQQSTYALTKKSNRYSYILSHFEDAVNQSSFLQKKELERKKRIIDEINTSIYGAIGEQKVSKDLENLSDDYILINDFTYSFHPPIYNRQENDYIKIESVQIDHLLVSPAGIFLIETKNWSEHSLNDLCLRSPVVQIKRSNFALFKILTGEIIRSLDQHHWGDRKIPIRNLIVLVNHKPNEEFQYVKILTLKELRNYVEYFKPSFSVKETQMIANYLLCLNESNN
jgi:hypothetical protein